VGREADCGLKVDESEKNHMSDGFVKSESNHAAHETRFDGWSFEPPIKTAHAFPLTFPAAGRERSVFMKPVTVCRLSRWVALRFTHPTKRRHDR
jgi:hypothetical protein